MAKIIVLGSGGFGLSLAILAYKYGHEVTVWSAFEDEIKTIVKDKEHKVKLPGVIIPEKIKFTSKIEETSGNEIVLFGIPSPFVRNVAKLAKPYISSNMIILNTGKGIEEFTYKRLSEVIEDEIPNVPIVILSGPSHAEEVARGIPTTVVVSSKDRKMSNYIQDVLSNEKFRIYVNDDIIGCELGGALKNIIALSAGISDGLGYGDNTSAALMTRGITEVARLGVAMGAQLNTFFGLTGIGDLIVTCTSKHSRNRRAGVLIGKGVTPEEAVNQVGTVEGYYCCNVAYEISRKMNIEMPITEQLNNILFNKGNVKDSLGNLMGRPHRHEVEKPLP